MKAYQLKIIEQKTKPPVWWRAIIPAGITFSILSVIIDEISERRDDGDFTFRFYQELELFEENDSNPLKARSWQYDAQEASSTFIDDYFNNHLRLSYKTNKLFATIEIEKLLDMEETALPLIVKTSSGIDAMQVNQRIRSKFSVVSGSPEFVKKEIIIDKLLTSKLLVCSVNPKSADDNIKHSARHYLEETGALLRNEHYFRTSNKSNEERKEIIIKNELKKLSYPQLLELYSFNLLKKEAKELKIPRYSVMEKPELCNALAEKLLEPVVVHERLLTLFPGDFELIENIIASDNVRKLKDELEEIVFEDVQRLAYGFLFKNRMAVIPKEIVEVYHKIGGAAILDERIKINWIEFILEEIIGPYYGFIPIDKFCCLCARKNDPTIRPDEVMDLFYQVDSEYNPCFMLDGCIADKRLADKKLYNHIKNAHDNKPFDIVPFSELEILFEEGYPAKNIYYIQLKRFFLNNTDLDKEDVEYILCELHELIAYGGEFEEIFSFLSDEGLVFSYEDTAQLVPILQGVTNNTRTYYNCGYTPSEIARILVRNKPKTTILQMPNSINGSKNNTQSKPRKIGPNEPCPCGSGKKYKKCCGKPKGE